MVLEGEALRERLMLEGDPTKHLFCGRPFQPSLPLFVHGPRSMMVANRNRLELLARLGYAARGAVSLIVGGLALLAALDRGGEATGSKGALRAIPSQPLGDLLLAAIALGLFGFAVWRAFQSLLDADGLGTEPKAIAVRAGQAVSAIVYVGLGVFALGLLLGWGQGGNGEQSAQDWTAWLLARPFGRWLVGAVGLAVVGAALVMAHEAWTASFRRAPGLRRLHGALGGPARPHRVCGAGRGIPRDRRVPRDRRLPIRP